MPKSYFLNATIEALSWLSVLSQNSCWTTSRGPIGDLFLKLDRGRFFWCSSALCCSLKNIAQTALTLLLLISLFVCIVRLLCRRWIPTLRVEYFSSCGHCGHLMILIIQPTLELMNDKWWSDLVDDRKKVGQDSLDCFRQVAKSHILHVYLKTSSVLSEG